MSVLVLPVTLGTVTTSGVRTANRLSLLTAIREPLIAAGISPAAWQILFQAIPKAAFIDISIAARQIGNSIGRSVILEITAPEIRPAVESAVIVSPFEAELAARPTEQLHALFTLFDEVAA
ncbi:hypothetical protein ACVXZ4_04115 [Lacisediminihabitans sp. FW035]